MLASPSLAWATGVHRRCKQMLSHTYPQGRQEGVLILIMHALKATTLPTSFACVS